MRPVAGLAAADTGLAENQGRPAEERIAGAGIDSAADIDSEAGQRLTAAPEAPDTESAAVLRRVAEPAVAADSFAAPALRPALVRRQHRTLRPD